MAEMTPRERVWAAINHQEPDRVPLDVGGGNSTTMVVEGYEQLKQYLGIRAPTQEMSKTFRLARLDEQVMQRLGSDCRPLLIKGPVYWTPLPSPPDTFVDIWGITWRKASYGDGCYYWELASHPLAEADIADLDRYSWPDTDDPGYTYGLADEARDLYKNTNYAIMADPIFKSFWELGYMLRGLEQFLVDLVTAPKFVIALLERLLIINARMTSRFLDAVGPYIQVFRIADDLATQQGPLMSPCTFRPLLKPFYKRYIELVKSKTPAKIFFHSCGNVTELLDDLIDVGVEIVNPVQVSAMGDTAALKTRFGNRLAFWGGIDTQRVLPYGTPADVEAEVCRRIRDLAPGGGYVAAAVHNIQPDVPPQNVIAMAEAVHKYGVYPLQM